MTGQFAQPERLAAESRAASRNWRPTEMERTTAWPGAPGTAAPLALIVERREYPTKDVLDGLVANGYHVLERQWAGSVDLAAELRPALIVAVVSPARAADLEVVRELAQSCDAFVVLLSDQREGIAAGLLAGAQACVCDSDGPGVFAAQFGSALRGREHGRPEAQPVTVEVAGPLAIDVAAHRAAYFSKPLHLSSLEYAILLYLVQHRGTMCRSSRMVAALMGEEQSDSVAGARLRSHILRIRRQLRAIAPGVDLISNVRGMGYRLDVPAGVVDQGAEREEGNDGRTKRREQTGA